MSLNKPQLIIANDWKSNLIEQSRENILILHEMDSRRKLTEGLISFINRFPQIQDGNQDK